MNNYFNDVETNRHYTSTEHFTSYSILNSFRIVNFEKYDFVREGNLVKVERELLFCSGVDCKFATCDFLSA